MLQPCLMSFWIKTIEKLRKWEICRTIRILGCWSIWMDPPLVCACGSRRRVPRLMFQGGRRWGRRVKQLHHLNKGLPDGFDSEGALNQVTAPTFFNADVKAMPGKQQKPALKIPVSLHKTQNEQPGDAWCPTPWRFPSQLLSFFSDLFSSWSLIRVLLALLTSTSLCDFHPVSTTSSPCFRACSGRCFPREDVIQRIFSDFIHFQCWRNYSDSVKQEYWTLCFVKRELHPISGYLNGLDTKEGLMLMLVICYCRP